MQQLNLPNPNLLNMTSTGNKSHRSLPLADLWCQVMSLPKEYQTSSVIGLYQLLEQRFPVAVSFHNLQEVAAQKEMIPACIKPQQAVFYISLSVLTKHRKGLVVNT